MRANQIFLSLTVFALSSTTWAQQTPLCAPGGACTNFLRPDFIAGIKTDLTVRPQPVLDVTKALGTGPQLIGRFPGSGGTLVRLYIGEGALFFTFNAQTGGGTEWTKDSTAQISTVYAMRSDGAFQRLVDADSAVSKWTTPQVSLRMLSNGFLISSKAPQIAVAGGTICGGTVGSIYPFPVQWPIPFEATPTTVGTGSDITSDGTNVESVSGVSRFGAVLNIRNVTGARCVHWIGYVRASN